ncbi:MAG TPA: cytochrome c biogenesis protein CcdA [Candidatus Limnocylindria bacterium]|nr:cytochrome c biogenesis protein CcdA [Candidatus Limnocylindria bacterium]
MSWMATRAASRPRVPITLVLIGGMLAAALASIAILLNSPAPAPAVVVPSAQTVIDDVERRAVADDGNMDIQAILATPAYFRMTGQAALAERYAASGDIVLILSQDIHYGELPVVPRPDMIIDGRPYAPVSVDTVFDSDHHRTVVLTYSDASHPLASASVAAAELSLAGAVGDLRWQHPFGGAGAAAAGGGLSIPLLLALMGGMLASMWPCLFQLTAYFLPSVAGLSFDQAREGRADGAVLRTAVLFVSGIVIVYTLAGLAAGFAAQSVSGTALFQAARQPLTFAAGLVIIAMAARLALRARRPLVCHMPTTSPKPRRGLGTVALGLAFATGCMTCFGAAVVLGMFTYVVTSASPFVGAAILFVFSLGIAVPLVVAAMAMARVLPLLTRLERVTPALTLLSAGIMGAYGVLLVTGTSHVMSDTIARLAGAVR